MEIVNHETAETAQPAQPPDSTTSPTKGRDLDFFGSVPCWTPEIEKACQQVSHWIRCDLPGGMIYGLQRVGKSFCAHYIKECVPEILGRSTLAVGWSIPEMKRRNECATLALWHRQSGSQLYNHSKAHILKVRLEDFLVDLANVAGAKRISIIIDEAHWLFEDDYGLLMSVCNDLQMRGKRPFVLLIGHPDLKQHQSNFSTRNSLQITGRYFAVEHQYHGIQLNDLSDLLVSMDDATGDGVAARHLPWLRAQGWQLSDLAQPMKDVIQTMCPAGHKVEDIRVPMQFARASLNAILYELIDAEQGGPEVSVELVRDAVLQSGIRDVLHLYATHTPLQ